MQGGQPPEMEGMLHANGERLKGIFLDLFHQVVFGFFRQPETPQ